MCKLSKFSRLNFLSLSLSLSLSLFALVSRLRYQSWITGNIRSLLRTWGKPHMRESLSRNFQQRWNISCEMVYCAFAVSCEIEPPHPPLRPVAIWTRTVLSDCIGIWGKIAWYFYIGKSLILRLLLQIIWAISRGYIFSKVICSSRNSKSIPTKLVCWTFISTEVILLME